MSDIFLNWDNTELKRSSKIFFFCCRTASLGGKGLIYKKKDILMRKFYTQKNDLKLQFPDDNFYLVCYKKNRNGEKNS